MLISPNYLMEVSHLFAGVARWVPARKKRNPSIPSSAMPSNFLEEPQPSKILEGSNQKKNPSYVTLCNAARIFSVPAVAALAFVPVEGP